MVHEIDRHEVQDLVARHAQVVDVMPSKEFEESHLPGAVNIPLKKIGEEALTQLDRGLPVIVYCYDSL